MSMVVVNAIAVRSVESCRVNTVLWHAGRRCSDGCQLELVVVGARLGLVGVVDLLLLRILRCPMQTLISDKTTVVMGTVRRVFVVLNSVVLSSMVMKLKVGRILIVPVSTPGLTARPLIRRQTSV